MMVEEQAVVVAVRDNLLTSVSSDMRIRPGFTREHFVYTR